MCYSNSSTSSNIQLSERYKKTIPSLLPDSPTFFANAFDFPNWRIITADEEIQFLRWGLVPFWYKSSDWKKFAVNTLNAQLENLEEKPSFKHTLKSQRCIIPSTGFFEYQHNGKEKTPFFIYPKNDVIFNMAGIYDYHLDSATGQKIGTFSIVTCPANEFMAEIHNTKKRMPLLLSNEDAANWLKEEKFSIEGWKSLSNSEFDAHIIDKKIISSPNPNRQEVQKPFVDSSPKQLGLF